MTAAESRRTTSGQSGSAATESMALSRGKAKGARPDSGSPIIVALDFPTAAAALNLAEQLDPARCRVKVGKALFTRAGPAVVEALRERGFQVFLDLKFHDIPATVAGAAHAAAELGVWMLNVHAIGGSRMLQAAREALEPFKNRPHLIGVTVLTSMDAADWREAHGAGRLPDPQAERLPHPQAPAGADGNGGGAGGAGGLPDPLSARVAELTALSLDNGLDGVVCSAKEAAMLRKRFGSNCLLVTPGIRPPGAPPDDQRRTATPFDAAAAGSDYLVVGRPVTQSPNPAAAVEHIRQDFEKGRQQTP